MTKLSYKKMSLFDAPKGSYLVHSCNAQGVWGSGIAVTFKKKFPEAYKMYNRICEIEEDIMGNTFTLYDNDYVIACMIVSVGYGSHKSPKDEILKYTESAIKDLLHLMPKDSKRAIYSNKFNSGFFGIRWAESEKILKEVLNKYDVEWVVCDPEML